MAPSKQNSALPVKGTQEKEVGDTPYPEMREEEVGGRGATQGSRRRSGRTGQEREYVAPSPLGGTGKPEEQTHSIVSNILNSSPGGGTPSG